MHAFAHLALIILADQHFLLVLCNYIVLMGCLFVAV